MEGYIMEDTLPGDSRVQREAEEWLITELSKKLKVKLEKKKWDLGESHVEVDGFSGTPTYLCEAWAHIGTPKSAQKQKVMTDTLKMIFINDSLNLKGKLVMLFADRDAAKFFKGKSWMAQCLQNYNIAIETIELPSKLKEKVLYAQEKQYR